MFESGSLGLIANVHEHYVATAPSPTFLLADLEQWSSVQTFQKVKYKSFETDHKVFKTVTYTIFMKIVISIICDK